jgi:cobalt/nickel transport system ATP-binding protein
LIRLKGIEYKYEDNLALKDIDLEIKEGERVVLLGNNGSGKSTLLKLLAGLIFSKSGEYYFNKNRITKKYLKENAKSFRKELAILFQSPDSMLFNDSVRNEIAFSLMQFDMQRDIEDLAKEFGIEHLLDRNPLKLSGGEKQKVALCAIFSTQPKVLILDEPMANLDPKSTGWLIDFLYEKKDLTTIISTHNLSLALELGSRAVVMDSTHKIIYDGDIKELFNNKSILLQANLMHKHRHNHNDIFHTHFHIHSW